MAKRVENLDAMDADDLTAYIAKHRHDRRYVTEIAIADLLRDSQNIRARGSIEKANRLVAQADRLYETLSPQEQW